MSLWAGYTAYFKKPKPWNNKQYFTADRLMDDGLYPCKTPPPFGSEGSYKDPKTGEHSGFDVYDCSETYPDGSGNYIRLSARIRDVDEQVDPIQCLSWFVGICEQWDIPEADLDFEIDFGPKILFEWREKKLNRVKGVLDF